MQIISPATKHSEYFKKFIRSLVDKFQPLQIFCFAQTNSFEELKGCFTEQETKYQCNYGLLLVTETPARIDYEVQDFANYHYQHGSITALCHGKETINEAIKSNNRFFITVFKTGQLIYSHDGMTNFDDFPHFIPSQSAVKASKHLSHHLPLAEGFLAGAGECLSKKQFVVCTFMLHQVVEQCLIVLIRVHLAYRSEIHNLSRMLGLCRSFSDKPEKMLLSGSKEDHRLFEVLTKSYSGARYSHTYAVNTDDATALYIKVSAFLTLTEEMCQKKIGELDTEATTYKDLQAELRAMSKPLADLSI